MQENYAKMLERTGQSVFLMEVQAGGHSLFFTHMSDSEDIGRLINHSAIHPNLTLKVFQSKGYPIVIFLTESRGIREGEQLVWNYGKGYPGLQECVEGCKKCGMLCSCGKISHPDGFVDGFVFGLYDHVFSPI